MNFTDIPIFNKFIFHTTGSIIIHPAIKVCRHALPMQSHHLFAPLVLSLPRQLASVFFVYPEKEGIVVKKSTLNCRLNKH